MKVKLKTTLVNGKETHAFGSVVDLKNSEAARLIERDLAVEYSPEPVSEVSVVQGAEAEAKAKADADAKAKEEAEAKAKADADAKAKADAEKANAQQQSGGQQSLG